MGVIGRIYIERRAYVYVPNLHWARWLTTVS